MDATGFGGVLKAIKMVTTNDYTTDEEQNMRKLREHERDV
jgi:hypothetical protein